MLALAFREEAEANKKSEMRKLISRMTFVEARSDVLAERLKAQEEKRG
jgi:hypothetical protein